MGALAAPRPRPPRWRARLLTAAALLLGPAAPAMVPAQPFTATASPSPQPGTAEWPNGGRFQDAGFADTGTLANRTYANHIPPELSPSLFLFQRVASGGYQAELDFPAPVIQLHWYSPTDSGDDGEVDPSQSVAVRHTVDLVLQPPSGDATTVSLLPDGGTVVTKGGAQVGGAQTVFAGTRLIMSVPASVGVQKDWTVQAVIRLAGDQPLQSRPGAQQLPATLSVATEPAVVGVMSGDGGSGAEPLASRALLRNLKPGVQPPDTVELPSGARPQSLRIEQSGRGLVAVVTMDAPPRPSATVSGRPVNQEEVHLSLAPGVQDGLGIGRVDVSYPYVLCANTPCPVSQSAAATLAGTYLGSLPVTVSGSEVRFDFGGFKAAPPQPLPQGTPNGALIGSFTKSIDLAPEDVDMIPIGGAPAAAAESTNVAIDGTGISIKRASGGAPATGSVNPFTGYFFASNDTEMWSGFLGKEGWYSRLVSTTAAPAAARPAPARQADLGSPQYLDRLSHYLWVQKNLDKYGDETPGLIRWFAIAAGAPFNQVPAMPDSFRHAVAQFLASGGQFSKDVMSKAFPNGYDPIVVVPPSAPAFPLASLLPGLAPHGAQWEIAAGMWILDRSGEGVRSLSPYVPASALLSSATGSTAAPGAAPAASPSSGGGGGAGLVIAIAVAVLAVAGGAGLWLRRSHNRTN